MKVIAMIPARMGSQRLKKKNLREIENVPLITRAIRKCIESECFAEIWVNSENEEFKKIAIDEGVYFHKRPEVLGDNNATSEDYIEEFLEKRDCDILIQVHSIAPLLTKEEVKAFTNFFMGSEYDVMLSCIEDRIEVAFNGNPVNFNYHEKTNSQELIPVQRITWSISGWRPQKFLEAKEKKLCATYYGKVGFFPLSEISGHVIKDELDLKKAEALLQIIKS